MNKTLRLLLIPLLIALIALISASIFVVKETERAVKLRFGEVVEADVPPGLHFKLPIINSVRKFATTGFDHYFHSFSKVF